MDYVRYGWMDLDLLVQHTTTCLSNGKLNSEDTVYKIVGQVGRLNQSIFYNGLTDQFM